MIRQANKYDKTEVIQILKECYWQEQFETKIDLDNEQYYEQLFSSIIAGSGVIFIEQGKGVLVAIINPSVFDPKTLVMNCLAWVVNKKHRNKFVSYKLIKTYIEYAEKLKQEGRIKYYTVNKASITPDINYAKLGFRKTDEVWIR